MAITHLCGQLCLQLLNLREQLLVARLQASLPVSPLALLALHSLLCSILLGHLGSQLQLETLELVAGGVGHSLGLGELATQLSLTLLPLGPLRLVPQKASRWAHWSTTWHEGEWQIETYAEASGQVLQLLVFGVMRSLHVLQPEFQMALRRLELLDLVSLATKLLRKLLVLVL